MVDGPTASEISGLPAVTAVLEIPESLCSSERDGDEPFCLGFARTTVAEAEAQFFGGQQSEQGWRSDRVRLNGGSRYEIYWVDLGDDLPPLVAMSGATASAENAGAATLRTTVRSLEVTPN